MKLHSCIAVFRNIISLFLAVMSFSGGGSAQIENRALSLYSASGMWASKLNSQLSIRLYIHFF